jgi:hypothetical protein
MYDLSILSGEDLGSAVRRRLVGEALRRFREHVGYGLAEAAKVLECDRCAPRGALLYCPRSGQELEEVFLGLMTYS